MFSKKEKLIMVDLILYQLPTLSAGFFIGLLIKILISSVTLYFSIMIVGGNLDLKKTIIFAAIMDVLTLVIFPFLPAYFGAVSGGTLSFLLSVIIWLVLIDLFFDVSISKAVAIALIQAIITLVIGISGVMIIIEFFINSIFVSK